MYILQKLEKEHFRKRITENQLFTKKFRHKTYLHLGNGYLHLGNGAVWNL